MSHAARRSRRARRTTGSAFLLVLVAGSVGGSIVALGLLGLLEWTLGRPPILEAFIVAGCFGALLGLAAAWGLDTLARGARAKDAESARLEALLAASRDVLFWRDPGGKVRWVSPSSRESFGIEAEELGEILTLAELQAAREGRVVWPARGSDGGVSPTTRLSLPGGIGGAAHEVELFATPHRSPEGHACVFRRVAAEPSELVQKVAEQLLRRPVGLDWPRLAEALGRAANAAQIAVLLRAAGEGVPRLTLAGDWCRPGTTPWRDALPASPWSIPATLLSYWDELVLGLEWEGAAGELPPPLAAWVEERGVGSLLLSPLVVERRTSGFVVVGMPCGASLPRGAERRRVRALLDLAASALAGQEAMREAGGTGSELDAADLAGRLAHEISNQMQSVLSGGELLAGELPGESGAHRLAGIVCGAARRASGLAHALHDSLRTGSPWPAEAVAELEEGESVEQALDGETVLLVDDEEPVLETLERALRALGYAVVTAHNGLEALDVARKGGVRVAVVDLEMPLMGGRESLARLRELDPSLPVLLSSGHADAPTVKSLMAEGAAGFLHKPYRIAELARALRRALSSQRV